jgi:two-component sensor histidine kinase
MAAFYFLILKLSAKIQKLEMLKQYRCGLILLFLINCTFAVCFAQADRPNPYLLLKQADSIFSKKPGIALNLASEVYQYSLKHNNYVCAVKSLNQLAKYYGRLHRFSQMQSVAHEAVTLSKRFKVDSLAGDANILMGIADYDNGNFIQAITDYQTAIKNYQQTKLYKRIALAYLDIGWAERKLGRFEIANQYYYKAIPLFQSIRDNDSMADVFNGIGGCYSSLNDYSRAIEFYQKSLAIRRQLADKPAIAESYNNLGYVYKSKGLTDSAIFYLNKAIAIRAAYSDSSQLVLPLQNMGEVMKLKRLDVKAEKYISRSLVIAHNYHMNEQIARGYTDIARINIDKKNWYEALKKLDQAEIIMKKVDVPELLMNIYSDKFLSLEKLGDNQSALEYYEKRDRIRDSLLTADKSRDIDILDVEYQTHERQKTIAILNLKDRLERKIVIQQKRFIAMLTGTAVLLLIMLLFAIYNYKLKKKANKRIRLLMDDIHHRVKNNLQILSGLFTMQIDSLNDEKTKKTLRENETRLASMNLIHNKLYLDHTTTQIEMRDYLSKLLQHIKDSFGDNDCVSLRLEITHIMLEADKAVAIGLIVNELATNAFKYAFDYKGGEIFVGLDKEGKSGILFKLSDNGKGIARVDKTKQESFGLKLVNLMAKQLNSTLIVERGNGTCYKMVIDI